MALWPAACAADGTAATVAAGSAGTAEAAGQLVTQAPKGLYRPGRLRWLRRRSMLKAGWVRSALPCMVRRFGPRWLPGSCTRSGGRGRRWHERRLTPRALPCGFAKVTYFPDGGQGLADVACCDNTACRPRPASEPAARAAARRRLRSGSATSADEADGWQLETLQHAFLDCPAVRPAVQWLAELWPRFGALRRHFQQRCGCRMAMRHQTKTTVAFCSLPIHCFHL